MWTSLFFVILTIFSGLITQCSGNCKKCPKNEIYEKCNPVCPPRYCGINIAAIECAPYPDSDECKPGCRCCDGYLRNGNGTCIPEDECPTCPDNEVYDVCPAPCPPRECGKDPATFDCAAPPNPGDPDCEPGCRCADGYYRNSKGKCVTQEECESCGKDERLEQCPASLCSPQTCSQLGFPIDCDLSDNSTCAGPPSCVCNDGLVKNDKGKCIPINKCPSCGGDPNAKSGCGVNCGRLCSNYKEKGVACPLICKINGCDCKKGYVYDTNLKKCVRPKDCTPTCGQYEEWNTCSNGGCDKRNCSQIDQSKICIDPSICVGGCVCQEGYLRSQNGSCIAVDQCPESQCKRSHEHFDPCTYDCSPGTCDTIGKYYNCPSQVRCDPSCACNDGYFRNSLGQCISEKHCLECPGDHEYWSCGGACDNVCATLSQQNQTNCPIVNIKCNPMCYCEEGYARDSNNNCIPIENCPKHCGKDEIWEQCPARLCKPQSCSQLGYPIDCTPSDDSPCPGPPSCICKDGFVRNNKGKCIPVNKCPSCGGDPHAESGCGNNCGRRCSDYNKTGVGCSQACRLNGCDCKRGFVYDSNLKKCVRPKDCTPTCSPYEKWDECSNGGCEKRNCSQIGQSRICVDPSTCVGACVCREGYLRSQNGSCIPVDQCPESQCMWPNEHFDPCDTDCSPGTCESIGKSYSCPAQVRCDPSCVCNKGYYRNLIGQCISEKHCLECPGDHEYWSCGGACDNVCATLSQQNQTNCPIVNIKCNPMCYCEEGYARDSNNICIPIENCPKHCGKDERWEQCPARLCTPQSCSQLGYPIDCIPSDDSTCPGPPSCVCKDGFVRNNKGKCIPVNKCPSCGGDPNAELGCGTNCGKLCSTYNETGVACSHACQLNGCDCRKGFFYDSNLKKCVRPKECTPTCSSYEKWDECSNGGCEKRNCSQIGQSRICKDPSICVGGCVCQEGYLRSKNGSCIPVDQCPESKCKRQNEHFEPCALDCSPGTCESIGKSYSCPAQVRCDPSCVCNTGYYRNLIGQCISEKHCLKCRGKHEYWSCGGACDNVCATMNEQSQKNCPIENIKCNPMCYCEEGYARNSDNECIPIEECPESC